MKKRTVLVLGSSGQLGKEIINDKKIKKYFKIFSKSRKEVDITNFKEVKKIIENKKPDFVINCAAYTNVDKAEKDYEKAHLVNFKAVENIAKLSNEYKSKLIHISTDYIFDRKIKRPIKENIQPMPINKYGLSKYLGEKSIVRFHDEYYILRVGWLYGRYGNNFPKKIIKLAKEKRELHVVNDQLGSPTPASLVANSIYKIMISNKKYFGIYNISPNGICSWFEVAKFINKEISNIEIQKYKIKKVFPISSNSLKIAAKRPKYSYLCNQKIKKTYNLSIHDWDFYLKRFLEKEL